MLAACATTPEQEPPRNTRVVQPRGTMTIEMNPQDGSASSAAGSAEDRARIYKGNGVVVKGQAPGGTAATPAKPAPSPEQIAKVVDSATDVFFAAYRRT